MNADEGDEAGELEDGELEDDDERRHRGRQAPPPTAEPEDEPSDPHSGPLDDDEDGRYLSPFDPRRIEAERRRGRPFDQDEGKGRE